MASDSPATEEPILVTGATGYVAGRQVPLLLAAGYRVRTMGRSLEKMGVRPWARHPNVQLAKGDIMKWVSMPTQPIAITNVLGYLMGCLEHPETRCRCSHQSCPPCGFTW